MTSHRLACTFIPRSGVSAAVLLLLNSYPPKLGALPSPWHCGFAAPNTNSDPPTHIPTSTLHIESIVQPFVAEISQLVCAAALESVEAALTGGAFPARRGPGRPRGSGKRRGPGRLKGSRNAAKAMHLRLGK